MLGPVVHRFARLLERTLQLLDAILILGGNRVLKLRLPDLHVRFEIVVFELKRRSIALEFFALIGQLLKIFVVIFQFGLLGIDVVLKLLELLFFGGGRCARIFSSTRAASQTCVSLGNSPVAVVILEKSPSP